MQDTELNAKQSTSEKPTDSAQSKSERGTSFNQENLKQQIVDFTPYCEKRKVLNQRLSIWIVILGIFLSLFATISGILLPKDARMSAIFGACAATTQAILFA